MNEWIYRGETLTAIPKDAYGFVYLITNTTNDKKYIGKKFFYSKRKTELHESNWKVYYGSSKVLLSDIEKIGNNEFKREILHLCKDKSTCQYMEAKELFDNNVLFSDNFYNKDILGKVRRKPILIDNVEEQCEESNNKIWVHSKSINKLVSKRSAKRLIESGKWEKGYKKDIGKSE